MISPDHESPAVRAENKPGIFQLAYVSAARPFFTATTVRDILATSRRNNQHTRITGILLYKGGAILQILEGRAPVVDRLYQVILTDPRHAYITLLYRKPIERREFADWLMAFRNLDLDHDIEPFPEGYSHLLNQDLSTDPRFDQGARKLLADFLAGIR